MLKVEFKISTISIPRKAWFCDPSPYHFSAKSTQFRANLRPICKIHPMLQIRRIGYVTITHPSIYQNLWKCTSKPLSIPIYHLPVRTPPRVQFPVTVLRGPRSRPLSVFSWLSLATSEGGRQLWTSATSKFNDNVGWQIRFSNGHSEQRVSFTFPAW